MISVIGVFERLMGLIASPVWLTWAGLTIVFGLYQFLGARRRYAAVGPGWLYLRTEPFGSGKWARFDDIQTIKVRSGGSLMPLLLLTTKQRRVRFTFDLRHPDLRTPVRRSLAQEGSAGIDSLDLARLIQVPAQLAGLKRHQRDLLPDSSRAVVISTPNQDPERRASPPCATLASAYSARSNRS